MLTTPTIAEIPTTNPAVHAFRVTGTVTNEDFTAMAERMNAVFDTKEDVSMLLIFEAFEGRETGASVSFEGMKSQMRSLSKVSRYATVGAPDAAGTMIETMDKIIPVDSRSFDAAEEAQAWAFVGAEPA